MANMLRPASAARTGDLLKVLGQPFRLQLLQALGDGEACVCHLERLLGKRQAYISQHLMALREAGLVAARRRGKYIFYRLKTPAVLELVWGAAELAGVQRPVSDAAAHLVTISACDCPRCAPQNQNAEKLETA